MSFNFEEETVEVKVDAIVETPMEVEAVANILDIVEVEEGAEPINYSEGLKIQQWKLAMVEELQEIERNNTWELFELPTHNKAINVMAQNITIICLYVDDLLPGMVVHQRKFVKEILKRFNMDDSNPTSSPVKTNLKLEKHGEEYKVDVTSFKQIIGFLRYVCNSRPDIDFTVRLVSRYMSEPRVSHKKVARRILRYLKGSIDYGILFQRDSEGEEATNDDWDGDKEDRRSTTGYFF
ncbi:uncharacterized mitochondrial protein AtMg00810-like [Vicia villosa]|uniref:uncharacterized mitochondrial protein AtMg00810-like n=1 Tax=Vicia villosa TaxID=3911 RepID=UPI00273B0FB9|nr:uncharacterized mitochondrial protein AtMg00810-like [Vicia villosa]